MQQGDQQAFAEIYDRFNGALYGVCMGILKRPDLAKDALQKAFVKIWQKAKLFRAEKASLYTWMLQITRNTAIDIYRSESRKNGIQNDEFSVHLIDQVKNVRLNEEAMDIKEHIEQLEEEVGIIIRMAYLGGYTQKQISDYLKIPLGTVKTRVRTGLMQLRRIYKK